MARPKRRRRVVARDLKRGQTAVDLCNLCGVELPCDCPPGVDGVDDFKETDLKEIK